MIKVYVSRNDPDSADIVDRLRELVVAHTIVWRDANPAAPSSGAPGFEDPEPEASGSGRSAPPLLVDGGTPVRGKREIVAHLETLGLILGEWSKFQSDACYCDVNGNVE